jgi:uncharacterized protein
MLTLRLRQIAFAGPRPSPPLFLLCLLLPLLVLLVGCGSHDADEGVGIMVTLPDGQKIRAEVMTRTEDMMRGMMFRDRLAPDRGMLFVHARPGRYTYHMRNVRIPLDIIWLNEHHRIVEISADTPPCASDAPTCPSYGGKADAQYVLELAGGMAKNYGLDVGDYLMF